MKYVSPGHLDSIVSVQPRCENFIGTKSLGLFWRQSGSLCPRGVRRPRGGARPDPGGPGGPLPARILATPAVLSWA